MSNGIRVSDGEQAVQCVSLTIRADQNPAPETSAEPDDDARTDELFECLAAAESAAAEAPDLGEILLAEVMRRTDLRLHYNHFSIQGLGMPNPQGWARGRCPFHADTHPSFAVNMQHSGWKCHAGCGSGTLLTFVMKRDRVPMSKEGRRLTILKLAEKVGIDVSAWVNIYRLEAELRAEPARAPEPVVEESEQPPTSTSVMLTANLTDVGNAQRLVERHGADLRYIKTQKSWVIWDGTRWCEDETGEIVRRGKDTLRAMYGAAQQIKSKGKRAALAEWALKSESHKALTSMIELAKTEPGVSSRTTDYDLDPFLFNCANGTMDLKTGELRPHRRDDMLMHQSPVIYDPAARAPQWDRFLHEIMDGDAELISFLQRAGGYALTGSIREECLFLFEGNGANGKGTFCGAIEGVMGSYATTAAFSTFLVRKSEGARNDIARLHGTRFVVASEASEGSRLDEAAIKSLTGGDRVAARFLYKEEFTYLPTFKLFFAVNALPNIRGLDDGIWRRIHLLPFLIDIPAGKRDLQLKEKLRQEYPGILRWLVEGCLEWQRQGLNPPQKVREASRKYRERMNPIAEFIQERCSCDPTYKMLAKDLYVAYLAWCSENHAYEKQRNDFYDAIKKQGFRTHSDGKHPMVVFGLRLRGSAAEEHWREQVSKPAVNGNNGVLLDADTTAPF